MEGFTNAETGEVRRGYLDVVKELENQFPDPDKIIKEKDKKEFVKLFSEYLRVEHVLQNYDEFAGLKDLQNVDMDDPEAVKEFKEKHYVDDEGLSVMKKTKIPSERTIQDYRSFYNDTRDWLRQQRESNQNEKSQVDWDDVIFEVELLKSQEINLDYILELIFKNNKKNKSKDELIKEARRMIRASLGHRAKETLIVDFINQSNLDEIIDKASIIEAFFKFAQAEKKKRRKRTDRF